MEENRGQVEDVCPGQKHKRTWLSKTTKLNRRKNSQLPGNGALSVRQIPKESKVDYPQEKSIKLSKITEVKILYTTSISVFARYHVKCKAVKYKMDSI